MRLLILFLFALVSCRSTATPSYPVTSFIRIDQFGYLCNSRKVAVIVDPQVGYNAADSYSPSTGTGQYQVRRWLDDVVVFSGTLTVWNGGATQTQSGDRGWWFDFSNVSQPGSYYIFDLGTGKGSYRFEIGGNVYNDVLKQACRMFYYQRCNFAKTTPYADSKWTDAAAFEGARQDRHARSRWDKNNAATEKDVSGGWFDAGDYSKYVPPAVEAITQLLDAYRLHPFVFTDNFNIPESGNGIPDILDEAKFEIDWFKKMQDATGTGGLLIKVGPDTWASSSPPSTDQTNRYYVPECTSSTLSGALVFAFASTIYRGLNNTEMIAFADDLKVRAISAWNRAMVTTSNFTTFQTDCDDQNIWAGDADVDAAWQKQCAMAAAVYLYEITGFQTFKNYVETTYNTVEPVGTGWWGPYRLFAQKAILRYSQLSSASPVVANHIRQSKQNTNNSMSLPEYASNLDLYRAHMPDAQYTWESNMPRSACGNIALDYVHFGINTSNHSQYNELAEQYIHWLHGINAQGIVMLSNMYNYGADSSANEIFHYWFYNNTIYDNAKTSSRGPAPGYVTGGPNKGFTVPSIFPPTNQPTQKAYKDWNTNWNGTLNENAFEITEPAIYCQAMYVQLLAGVIDNGKTDCGFITLPVENTELKGSAETKKAILKWQGIYGSRYNLERSNNGNTFTTIASLNTSGNSNAFSYIDDNLQPGVCWYRLLIRRDDGNKGFSNTIKINCREKPGFTIRKDPLSNVILIKSDAAVKATVKIFTSDSRLLQSTTFYFGASESRPLNTQAFSHGTYWIEVSNSYNRAVEKIVL